MAFIIHRYRLLDPLDWDKDCDQHLHLQIKFWNKLVEIEQAYREGYRRILASDIAMIPVSSAIAKLRTEQATLIARRKELRAEARSRLPTPLIDECLTRISQEIRALAAVAKVQAVTARERMADELQQLDKDRYEAAKLARQESKLWWCNYNAVWRSYRIARRRTLKEGTGLRFHGFRGEGRFTVQLINGLPIDKLMNGEGFQIHLDLTSQPVPWRTNKPLRAPRMSVRGRPIGAEPGRQGTQRPRLTVTIYTVEGADGKKRRTLTFPIIYDRPLPPDGRIQEVAVTRRRLGTRLLYHAIFMVRIPDAAAVVSGSTAVCGINFGFRLCADGGLRIAMLADADGTREFKLPAEWMKGMEDLEALQQSRDLSLDEITAVLKEQWPRLQQEGPAEIIERLGKLLRAPRFGAAKLAVVSILWRRYPFYCPEMRDQLEAWRRLDKHRLEVQANRRDHLLAQRLERYRLLAREIAQRYGVIQVGEIALRDIALRERDDGSENELFQHARRNRTRAALYQLQTELRHQAAKSGAPIYSVAGGYTQKCHACEAECAVTDELVHRCEHCCAEWDQDENAARNILRASPEESLNTDDDDDSGCGGDVNDDDSDDGPLPPDAMVVPPPVDSDRVQPGYS